MGKLASGAGKLHSLLNRARHRGVLLALASLAAVATVVAIATEIQPMLFPPLASDVLPLNFVTACPPPDYVPDQFLVTHKAGSLEAIRDFNRILGVAELSYDEASRTVRLRAPLGIKVEDMLRSYRDNRHVEATECVKA